MNVIRMYFEARGRQFRNSWPGLRAFWPGFPMGIAAGLPLFVFLRTVWPGLLAAATALFVTFAIFLFVQGRDVPVMREYPGQGALIVLAVSAAGAAVSTFVGFMVAWGVRLLFEFVGYLT